MSLVALALTLNCGVGFVPASAEQSPRREWPGDLDTGARDRGTDGEAESRQVESPNRIDEPTRARNQLADRQGREPTGKAQSDERAMPFLWRVAVLASLAAAAWSIRLQRSTQRAVRQQTDERARQLGADADRRRDLEDRIGNLEARLREIERRSYPAAGGDSASDVPPRASPSVPSSDSPIAVPGSMLLEAYDSCRGDDVFASLAEVGRRLVKMGAVPSEQHAAALFARLSSSQPTAVRINAARGREGERIAIYREHLTDS